MTDHVKASEPVDARRPMTDLEAEIAELREAVAARDNFIAMVAHELRNPMTPILGQVQRLKRLALDGSDPVAVAHSAERTERLILLYIKRATVLLDVTRMRAGRIHLNPEPHDVVETAKLVIESLAPAAAYSGCEVHLYAVDAQPVLLDRVAVEQILENLLGNAIKYAPGKPIRLAINFADDCVVIAVSDHGPGISLVDQQRIFERFERVLATGSSVGGFGIGLWVVRLLAEAMRGSIKVDSVEGVGSTFTVRLPRVGAGAND